MRRTEPDTSDYWLGLHSAAAGTTGASYVWYDGSASTYRQWAPGEPAPAAAGQQQQQQHQCVRQTKDGMKLSDCAHQYRYTCRSPDAGRIIIIIITTTMFMVLSL